MTPEIFPIAEKRALFLFDTSQEGRVFVPEGEAPLPLAADDLEAVCSSVEASGDVTLREGQGDLWAALKPDTAPPHGLKPYSRRDLPTVFGYEYFNRAGVAFQMMNLHRRNRFCGVCGAAMADHPTERARSCPDCGNIVYPVLAPAIIVAVEKDGMLLMGHGVNFPPGRYSVLAGFVEPGETLEQTVAREVFEESRVKVKNIRYFGSQPWPFPASMMLGFRAQWAGGEPQADGVEQTDVRWFRPDELPDMPASVSIARKLIDDWLGRTAASRR